MALTIQVVQDELNDFLLEIADAIASGVTQNAALPVFGDLSQLSSGSAASELFTSLNTKVQQALAGASGGDPVDAIVAALQPLAGDGIHAVRNAAGGVDITFARTTDPLTTGSGNFSVGGVNDAFHLGVTGGASLVASVNATLSFAPDGGVSLADNGTEVNVHLEADLSVSGAAKLGVADVTLQDADAAVPEFNLDFGFDLGFGPGGLTIDPKLSGSAALELRFETDMDTKLLPKMGGEFILGFGIDGDGFADSTVSIENLTVDLGSYIGILKDAFGGLGDVFNATPFDELMDVALEPIPGLNDIAQKTGAIGLFDRVGSITGGPDQVLTIGDLVAYQNPAQETLIARWYQALAIIDQFRQLDELSNAGTINLGGATLVGGGSQSDIDPAALVAAVKGAIADLGLDPKIASFLSDIDISGVDGSGGAAPSSGFSFSLFEHPEKAFDILLTRKPVDLVTFDVPALGVDQRFGDFFPILGPLGVLLEGQIKAKIDINVGYDTQGLLDNQLDHGFFLTTTAAGATDKPWMNPKSLPFLPAGVLDTSLAAGAGVGFAGSSITANVRLGFGLYAYFEAADADGKFRPTVDDLECIFEPIGGRADISVNVTIKIGFGPFSITKNIPLAGATLADFTIFTCPPATFEAPPQSPGLATTMANASLRLNVGPDAGARKLTDDHGNISPVLALANDPNTPGDESLNESYVIGLARDSQGGNINSSRNTTVVVPGKLDVFAFGFTQRVAIPTVITANFAAGDDMLVIQKDVTTGSDISAGTGNDTLFGGAGVDTLRGEGDNDYLAGNDGADFLYGGDNDDQLSGGGGGDRLDGGDGFDTVDYSGANAGTTQGVSVTITMTGDVFGHGGEADGDTLISIESLIGTDNDDDFRAGFGVTQALVFDGGAGGDILIGGKGEDLLIGGVGADHINGDDASRQDNQTAYDGVTYVTSWGQVEVDLARVTQRYGDAQGDKLYNVEAVEGSTKSDTLRGNHLANWLAGNDGNDTLEGRGGADKVFGDFGDDLIYGGADGDLLDGGEGTDTLSYLHVAGPVIADLGFGIGSGGDSIVMVKPALLPNRGRSTFENLIGSNAGDVLGGDTGMNRIEGRDGDDTIDGDGDDDILIGGKGRDHLIGGGGSDWVYYNDSFVEGVTVDLGLNFGTGGTADGDTFATVENILGSRFADDLRGNAFDNIIDPNISGRAVTEQVDGRDGTDTLRLNYSGVGVDKGQGVIGGFAVAAGTPDNGAFTRLTSSGSATLDTVNFDNIERIDIVATRRADTIRGGRLDDRIITDAGDDTIHSGLGADVVLAGSGNDRVTYGNDATLALTDQGGATPFYLDGGSGIDTLSVSLGQVTQRIVLIGNLLSGEFGGTNLSLANGAGIARFEILGDVTTGSGNDLLMQLGVHDNVFRTGAGDDTIAPGLGIDIVDGGAFYPANTFERDGDLLVLDYSSLTGYGVTSHTTAVRIDTGAPLNQRFTGNVGTYQGWGADPDAASKLHLDFSEIERIDVVGSSQNDILSGTHNRVPSFETESALATGDDKLDGGGGNDVLFGHSGDDVLKGGDGNDILIGAHRIQQDSDGPEPLDYDEVDILWGGAGADLFVLGTAASADGKYRAGVLYNDQSRSGYGFNQGILKDFNPGEGDQIQLFGAASDYRTVESNGSTLIFLKDGAGGSQDDEPIATIENFTGFSLNGSYIVYVDENTAPTDFAPLPDANLMAPQGLAAPQGSALQQLGALALAPLAAAFTVTQADDADALKAMLDGGSGAINSTLTLQGHAASFGTFENDPFGLGAGIILSTGNVEDLPGPNTIENGGSNVTSVPAVFERLGRLDSYLLDVYRLDLSDLGVSELRSLTIRDTNTAAFGGAGLNSGFDLATVIISTKKLENLDGLTTAADLDNELPKLSVFDYSAAGTHFWAGHVRGGGDDTLMGAASPYLVNNTFAGLGDFGASSSIGAVSMGDGGYIQFDFTQVVSTAGVPLYLYVAEWGDTEPLSGTLDVSADFARPSGDLSSDLGVPGTDDDEASLTYTFTPKAGDNAFSLDVVLFSEELPEFNGITNLSDLFSITLNGVEIGSLSNGASLSIQDLVYSGSGDLVLNPVGSGPLADQIRADAYTRTLRISGALVEGGENTLTITVKDGRDGWLDSGLLVKDDSFRTFQSQEFTVGFSGGGGGGGGAGGSGTILIGGNGGKLVIQPPPGGSGGEVVVKPDGNLRIPGAGPDGSFVVPFNPGDGPKEIPIEAGPGARSGDTGTVHYEVRSDDPNIDGQEIAPDVFHLIRPDNAGVNDPPVNILPSGIDLQANVPGAVQGLSVDDPDAAGGVVTTTLAVQFGILTVASVSGGAAVAGSGTATVTLTGTVAEINTSLAGSNVVYAGPQDFFGTDTLTMTTNDHGNIGPGGPLTDTDQVAIHLNTYLLGTSADDSFTALPGNEFITGLLGNDSITFDFALVEAEISHRGNQVIIDGPNGSHTVLNGFETFHFTDGTVSNRDGDYLVDDLFYYSQNHDVWNAQVDADWHYHTTGWREGRDPNAFFDTSFYLAVNSDVKAAGVDPLHHFHVSGWHEGRLPSLDFDTANYLARYPDVAGAKVDPLAHFLEHGAEENRAPVARSELLAANGFDYAYYLLHNPDVAAAGVDPYLHFQTHGWREGRDPNALFDVRGYLTAYTDVAGAQINPLDHYNQFGWREGRDPSLDFDTRAYLAQNPDVAAAHVNPLNHYLVLGIHEGRSAVADSLWG